MTLMYLLDSNQDVIEIVPKGLTLELWQEMGINEIDTLHGTMILNPKLKSKIDETFYVGVPDMVDKHSFNLYRLIKKEVTNTEINIQGIQLGFDELASKGYIKDMRPKNEPFQSILSRLLQDSGWSLGFVDDRLPIVNGSFYYMNRLEAIGELINLTGAELKFKVAISNNKITDKYVEAYLQMGSDSGKRFTYGSNSLDIVAEENVAELYTAILGRGRGEEVSSADDNASGQAGYGRKIDFAEIEWKKSSGNPVDKPKGQEYVEIPEATEMFGFTDGSPRLLIKDYPNIDDPAQLIQASYRDLLDYSRPKVQFKTKVENVGNLHVGDTVSIIRYDLDLKYQARVFKVKYNRLDLGASEIDLGDALTDSNAKSQAKFRKQVSREIREVDRAIENTYIVASDGTRVNHGADEPVRKKVNDVWFETLNDGTTRIRVWDGNQWVIEIDTSDTTKNADAIKEQQKEIEEAKQQAKLDAKEAYEEARAHADAEVERINTELSTDIGGAIDLAEQAKADAVTKANQALDDAKAHAEAEDARIKQEIGLEVDGAIEIAEQAKQDAIDKANQALADAKAHADAEILQFNEHFDGVLESVESDVADAQATADEAVNEINTAITNAGFTSLDEAIGNVRDLATGVKSELELAIDNAGFTSLDETVQSMMSITTDAEQRAQEAIDSASNAYGLAQTSISEAQTAQENSLSALGKADNALDGVSNLDVRVDDVEAELELKADNTFMNEDGTLTTLSNAITFNAHRFSSDMSRIESRVESLAGEINLVILKDAFEETRVIDGEVYPNPTPHSRSDTMREMINVTPGEKLAISKENSPLGYDWFTINYYDENYDYIESLLTSSNQQVITIPSGVYKMWVAYPVGSNPQITRGTVFLPYRPNIADQMTADEVTVFRNEYDEFADKTERRLTAIDSSDGRLSTAELLITQTANGLALKADQTTVNELTGEVESLGTEFDIVAGQVSSRVWNTDIENAVDGVAVGGRNLLKSTATFDYPWDSGHYLGMDDPLGENNAVELNPDRPYLGYLVSRANMSKFEPGQYVLSFWAKGDSIRTHQVGYRNGGYSPRVSFEVTPEWNHYIIKFETTDITTSGRVVYWDSVDGLVLAYPKLEKGNKATDWTPAPEDTAEAINHVESELTQKHDSITATVSSLDGRVAQQRVTLDSIVSTVSDVQKDAKGTTELLNQTISTVDSQSSALATIRTDLDGKATIMQFNTLTSTVDGTIQRVGNAEGKITQIENSVDGLQTTVASKASQSQVTQLATGLSSVVTELDNLEVGGRNLFVNTTTWRSPWDSGHYTEVEDPLGENNAVILNPNNPFLGYIVPQANMSKFEPGDYVLSFWAKGDSVRTHSVGYRNGGISPRINFDVTTQWNHYVMKFTTTDKTITGRVVFWDSVDGLALAYPKLEKGTIATDWTPAPEDTNDKFEGIETEWTQTFDTFSQTVAGIDGRVTTQKQTIEGLESTIQATQSDLSGTVTLLNQTKETVDSRTRVLAELRTDVDGKVTTTKFNTLEETVGGSLQRIGDAEGNITQIEKNVGGLQSTVADKASQSQVTQLANGLSSVVRDVSNIPIWTKVLPRASQDNPVELTDLEGNSLSTNSSYEIYLSAMSGTSVDNYSIYAYNNGGFKLIGRSGSGVDASLFRNNNRVWVETNFSNPSQGYHYTVTVTELASQGGRSSISQLSDNINLRVEKGDVLSQINIEAERTLIQTGKLLLDAKNTIVTGDFAVSGNAIVGGDMQLNKGLRVMNGTDSVLSVVDGNVRMNVGSLFIGSEDVENKISTAIYQNNKSLGLRYTNEAGQEQSLISVGADGVYVAGRHILLNGRTMVDGSFMVSGENVVLDANTTILGDFTVSGGNVVLDADTIVTGDFAVLGENIILDGNTTVTDNFTVTGGNIILDGDTTIHDNFTVTGGNVVLDADTLVQGSFTVSGGNVILDGNTTVRGGFTVLGENVTLDANTTILGDFSVFGKNITLDADTTILGDFSVFGKNIILDGDTTVQGTFKVTDTMIAANAEIDGAKIQDASIGSAKIASLNVSKITGNTSNFVQSNWNSINSSLLINGYSLTYSHTDGSQTVMNAQGLFHREGTHNYQTNYLFDIFTVTGLNRVAGNPLWYQLPDIYKNKNFKAVAVLSDLHGITDSELYYDLVTLRIVTYVDRPKIDRANARVPIVGYHRVRRTDGSWIGNFDIQVQLLVQY